MILNTEKLKKLCTEGLGVTCPIPEAQLQKTVDLFSYLNTVHNVLPFSTKFALSWVFFFTMLASNLIYPVAKKFYGQRAVRFFRGWDFYFRWACHCQFFIIVGPAYLIPLLVNFSCRRQNCVLFFTTFLLAFCVTVRTVSQQSFWSWLLPNADDWPRISSALDWFLDTMRCLKKLDEILF